MWPIVGIKYVNRPQFQDDAAVAMRRGGLQSNYCEHVQGLRGRSIHNEQMGNISRELKPMKRNKMEILELKTIITEMKNSQNGFNSRLKVAEESVNES